MKEIKLFCFPYAGGSSVIYEKWRKFLYPSIKLIPIEYAGRGNRFNKPLLENINDILEDIFLIIEKNLDKGDEYSLFGHSMGALIAYELSYKLISENFNSPTHVFFSGKLAPHIENSFNPINNLNDLEFKQKILQLGGTPIEALKNDEWSKLFLPILKTDFKAVENYIYCKKDKLLPCNFSILYGQDDFLTANRIEEWTYHTKKQCTFLKFSGGHFFLKDHTSDITTLINNTLSFKY